MKFITEPSVKVIGRLNIDGGSWADFCDEMGIKESCVGEGSYGPGRDSEVICEIAGRLCYLSFAKPRPGGNAAYLHNILESGHGSVLEHAVWNLLVTGVSRSLTHELVRHRAGVSPSQLSQRYVDESVAEYVVPPDLQEEVATALKLLEVLEYETNPDRISLCYNLVQNAVPFENMHKEVWWGKANFQGNFADIQDRLLIGLDWLEGVSAEQARYARLANRLLKKFNQFDTSAMIDELHGPSVTPPTNEQKTANRKRARQAARSVLPNATETKIFLTINARAARNVIEQRGSKHAEPEIRMLAYKVWQILAKEAPNLFDDYRWFMDRDNLVPLDVTTPYRKV